ncbi:MAG TPA: TMEM175 family protein [Acidimicrobiales bacterium]|nr:TMEM175 family protein [Acidimicrobiales bacterium]
MHKGRLESLSDSVFAVAMTLLVFDLHLPPTDLVTGFGHYFTSRWPHYAGFALSFAMIAMIWVEHHWIFHQLRKVDNVLVGINMLLLGLVVLLPFPTATLASYLEGNPHDEHLAIGAYALTLVAIAIVMAGMWLWASRDGRLTDPELTGQDVKTMSTRVLLSPAAYLVGFFVSFATDVGGLVIISVGALSYLWKPETTVDRVPRKERRHHGEPDD